MSHDFSHKFETARVGSLFAAALVLACAFATVTHAAAQLTPPSTPDTITVQGELVVLGRPRLQQPGVHLPGEEHRWRELAKTRHRKVRH